MSREEPDRAEIGSLDALRAIAQFADEFPPDGDITAEMVTSWLDELWAGHPYVVVGPLRDTLRDRDKLREFTALAREMSVLPRQDLFAATFVDEAVDRLDGPGGVPEDDVIRLVAEASVFRWAALKGEPPQYDDWDDLAAEALGWPPGDLVDALYGDMNGLWERSGILDSRLADAFERTLAAEERAAAAVSRAEEQSAQARRTLAEARRRDDQIRELERRVQAASGKADDERAQRRRAERERDEARRRSDTAETALAAAREGAAAPAADDEPAEGDRESAAALALARAELATLRTALERAHAEQDRVQRELEEEQRARAYRERHSDEDAVPAADGAAAAAGEDVWAGLQERLDALPRPATVAEAVQVAAERCPHLAFAERAFVSAAESPYRDPTRILGDLVKLDRLAELYVQGSIGRPVFELARTLNLNWAEGADAAQHGRYGRHYRFTHAGREWILGPHLRTSAGAGAGGTARTYLVLHPGDDTHPRQVIVGAVGRKLPDSTI